MAHEANMAAVRAVAVAHEASAFAFAALALAVVEGVGPDAQES